MELTQELSPASVLGAGIERAMGRARDFLRERPSEELLRLVGSTVGELAVTTPGVDRAPFPASYGGGGPCDDDLLAGLGTFYVTEAGKVMLDCTSGHYQMTWGYNHPALLDAIRQATDLGIVWDNHSNIPSFPVRRLAHELTSLGAEAGLDRVLLGVCTGSVACGAALKIMLARYWDDPALAALGPPAVVALDGNYHGTDMLAQTLRGMWPRLGAAVEPVQVQPNDGAELRATFERFGRRVAGFWAEPIMMNREAIVVEPEYLQLARTLCSEHGALMAVDEIQTGFWYPEVFYCRRIGLAPDILVVGKGMTAGFHSLAGLLYRPDLDILAQYDAISTNGSASLAAYVGLCCIRLIEEGADRLRRLAARHEEGLRELAARFPALIEAVNGDGFLTGLRFRDREDALGFHRSAVERGLWLRAHAYHPGHRTVLTKFPLTVEEPVVEFLLERLGELCKTTPWR